MADKKKLWELEFECSQCGKVHELSNYAIAQLASGHSMVHTCDCGNETYLEP
jgi:hypothetical protein